MPATLIIDNGASTIKAGLSTNDKDPRVVINAVVRAKGDGGKLFMGHEIDECRDCFSLHYRLPFERVRSDS